MAECVPLVRPNSVGWQTSTGIPHSNAWFFCAAEAAHSVEAGICIFPMDGWMWIFNWCCWSPHYATIRLASRTRGSYFTAFKHIRTHTIIRRMYECDNWVPESALQFFLKHRKQHEKHTTHKRTNMSSERCYEPWSIIRPRATPPSARAKALSIRLDNHRMLAKIKNSPKPNYNHLIKSGLPLRPFNSTIWSIVIAFNIPTSNANISRMLWRDFHATMPWCSMNSRAGTIYSRIVATRSNPIPTSIETILIAWIVSACGRVCVCRSRAKNDEAGKKLKQKEQTIQFSRSDERDHPWRIHAQFITLEHTTCEQPKSRWKVLTRHRFSACGARHHRRRRSANGQCPRIKSRNTVPHMDVLRERGELDMSAASATLTVSTSAGATRIFTKNILRSRYDAAHKYAKWHCACTYDGTSWRVPAGEREKNIQHQHPSFSTFTWMKCSAVLPAWVNYMLLLFAQTFGPLAVICRFWRCSVWTCNCTVIGKIRLFCNVWPGQHACFVTYSRILSLSHHRIGRQHEESEIDCAHQFNFL